MALQLAAPASGFGFDAACALEAMIISVRGKRPGSRLERRWAVGLGVQGYGFCRGLWGYCPGFFDQTVFNDGILVSRQNFRNPRLS